MQRIFETIQDIPANNKFCEMNGLQIVGVVLAFYLMAVILIQVSAWGGSPLPPPYVLVKFVTLAR